MTALWNIGTILLDTILLIVASFLVIIIFILTIVQNFRRKPTIIGRTAIILLIMGLLFLTLLVFRGQELGAADWARTLLMIGLVLVTAFYASSAEKQADASIKIARETKDARFAALKPIVVIDWISGERGRAFSPYFENIGLGPALNVKCYCTHTKFEFKVKQDRTTLRVGKREHITLLSEDFDFKGWAGFAMNCDYQSIYGENFRSILRFKTEQERNLEILELK